MNVSVIIPNWNGKKQLEKNLPSVVSESPYEIIVVDDASTDDSVVYLEKNFPQVKIIKNQTNQNFARTVNKGVAAAKGELVCLLNTDVKPRPGFIKQSLKYFNESNLFGVSLHELGHGPSMPTFIDGFIGYARGIESNTSQPTFWVSGGSSIIRKFFWEKLNGFDSELFPYYLEDLDLSYRAVKMGFMVLWIPDALVEHNHETSYRHKYSAKSLSFSKEIRLLVFNWKSLTETRLLFQHFKGLIKRVIRSPGYIKVILSSLKYLPQIHKIRTKEKSAHLLTDSDLLFPKSHD